MKEAFELVEKFLRDEYDPWAFSYDLPGTLIKHVSEYKEENINAYFALNEICLHCGDYDDDYPLERFKERVRVEYEKAKAIYKQEKH